MEGRMKACYTCKQMLPLARFSRRSARHGQGHLLNGQCRDCHNDGVKRRHLEKAARVNEVKLARGCGRCGYREHAVALDFDHREGEEKLFNISAGLGKPWPVLEAEMAKCDVLCANCHRVVTAERRLVAV